MREHTDIINASGDLRRAVQLGDRPGVEGAADTLAGLLNPHTHAEEVGLFAVMREQEDFADHIDSLCAEHGTLDDQLARIRGGEHTLLDTFIHTLREHIDREDNGLFPASAIALDGPDWERVDAQTPQDPREQTPHQHVEQTPHHHHAAAGEHHP